MLAINFRLKAKMVANSFSAKNMLATNFRLMAKIGCKQVFAYVLVCCPFPFIALGECWKAE